MIAPVNELMLYDHLVKGQAMTTLLEGKAKLDTLKKKVESLQTNADDDIEEVSSDQSRNLRICCY